MTCRHIARIAGFLALGVSGAGAGLVLAEGGDGAGVSPALGAKAVAGSELAEGGGGPEGSARKTLEPIEVTEAAPQGPDPETIPASVTIIPIDQETPASADVAQVVESTAGTTVQRIGGLGDWSAVSIRGSTLRQVQVYLDGVPLNPDGSDTVNLAELPLQAFSRVEIYRSDPPPALGAAPIGGVINLVTGERDVPASLTATYGSLGTGRLTALARGGGRWRGRPVDALAVVETFVTQGDFTFFADNGTAYNLLDDHLERRGNNDKSQVNLHGRLRLGDDSLRITALDAFLSREEGIPGHSNSPAAQTRLGTTRNLAVLELDGGRGLFCGSGRVWAHVGDERYDDRAGEVGTGGQWTRSRTSSWGGLVSGAWATQVRLGLDAALEARHDTYHAEDLVTERQEPARARTAGTLTLNATWWAPRDRLSLSGTLQTQLLDNRSLGENANTATPVGGDVPDLLLEANPRGGVLLKATDRLVLKASAGRYLRPPDFTELFGDRGAVIGNTDLVPEEGWKADAGGRLTLPARGPVSGTVDLSGFWSAVSNLIVFVQNAQKTMIPVNLGRTRVIGLEAAVSLEVLRWLELQGNLTWNHSTNLSRDPAYAGNQLPRLPVWEGYAEAVVHHGDLWRLGYNFSYADGNYWDATNWYRAAPRALHGAFVRVLPRPDWPSLELSILNLTNRIVEVAPRNPLDPEDTARVVEPVTDFAGYPLPGRTILLSVRWTG